jgi:hypothetical protein
MRHIFIFAFCILLASCRNGLSVPVSSLTAIPPELSIEEHALARRPEAEYTQLYFAESTPEGILPKHAGERSQIISFMDRSCTMEDHFGQCVRQGADQLAAWVDYTSGPFNSGSVTLTRNGKRIYRIPVGDSSPIESLRGIWTYDTHWALETAFVTNHHAGNVIDSQASGQISLDGILLNQQFGYQEAFGFQTMHGKSFYFYKQGGEIGVVYNNVAIPLGYAEIPHYGCCSAATLNPRVAQNMVAFFARKGSTWYYVEIGVFGQYAP